MIIYPAVDLIKGQCVRLVKGDFARKKVYETSPFEIIKGYKNEGARWLHVVDLDGARDPTRRQTALISEIIKESNLFLQVGGGVRSIHDVEALLAAGVSRVVIGSLALTDHFATREILKEFGAEQICLAADVKPENGDYNIAISGWQESTTTSLEEFIEDYLSQGLLHILCTDISRDGTMEGCNFELYKNTQTLFPALQIQASGGINSLNDLRKLRTSGAIIGKALYEQVFTLQQAFGAISC
ncbi:MAG: 1-(5-phosphoribosyl)-5-[(5-phosphoribosylamino)methylideneamino]imidazole-4-carboxamide isomerase [Pseudomonadota bacterium]|nr:1-(5-phosphoribosyl)-5-[(5-phosphoribosylamino)methylideneamino]imidazole-4-carboxamide isomerase [Pseudomonadota bacterium]